MSGAHHTRVYGGLTNCRPWLSACVSAGFVPDILFTLGRRYVVATSSRGELYIRRGPNGPLELSLDPVFFDRRIKRKAENWLRAHMSDLSSPMRTVSWTPETIHRDQGNYTLTVS